jgi:hypothetical protein
MLQKFTQALGINIQFGSSLATHPTGPDYYHPPRIPGNYNLKVTPLWIRGNLQFYENPEP